MVLKKTIVSTLDLWKYFNIKIDTSFLLVSTIPFNLSLSEVWIKRIQRIKLFFIVSASLFSALLIRNSLDSPQSLSNKVYSDIFQSKILCGFLCGTKAQARKKPLQIQGLNSKFGGSGEIRTHGGGKPSSVFKLLGLTLY